MKKHSANEHKKRPKPMSCAERKRFVKNCGLLAQGQVGDNKQKISPNLMKRTDFLVHKAQFLVGVTGFEPAASTSQTARHRFFASFYVLFRAFSSETRAFSCRKVHISHVVQTCKWSRLWSRYSQGFFEIILNCIQMLSFKPYT